MTTYTRVVVACPRCGELMADRVLMSTMISGQKRWSDGFWESDLNKPSTRLRTCSAGHPFLADEAEAAGDPWALGDASVPAGPDFRRIAEQADDPSLEYEARLWIWWDQNEPWRGRGFPPLLDEFVAANAERLLALAPELQADLIILQRGQLLRQLSRFDEARAVYRGVQAPAEVLLRLDGLCDEMSAAIVDLAR